MAATKKRATGRPAFKPTDAQRELVTGLKLAGFPDTAIAEHLEIDKKTLCKYFKEELKKSLNANKARLANMAWAKAFQGSEKMIMFLCKTQLKWRETSNLDIEDEATETKILVKVDRPRDSYEEWKVRNQVEED